MGPRKQYFGYAVNLPAIASERKVRKHINSNSLFGPEVELWQ